MRNKISWEEIYNSYTLGIQKDGKLEFPTLQDLAKEYHLSFIAIRKRSSKDGWVKAREDYLKDRQTKSEQKVVESISSDISEFDIGLFNQAKTIREKLITSIEEAKNNPYQLSCIANTILTLKNIEKSVLGESVEEKKEKTDLGDLFAKITEYERIFKDDKQGKGDINSNSSGKQMDSSQADSETSEVSNP